jgi:ABC transport system ATP-binding/permease protein
MPFLFRRQTRDVGAARAEQDRLLSGVLQIFALIASADGPVNAEREQYVQSYLESLNPSDTPRLLEEFKRNAALNLPLDTTVAALEDVFRYEEKLFVLGKSYEVLGGKEISEGESRAARSVAWGLGIHSLDATIIEDHFIHERALTAPVAGTPVHVHVLRLSDNRNAPDELSFPLPGLRAEIYGLAGGYYIRQRDDQQIITIGGQRLRRNFLTKIRRLDALRIGGVMIRQGDLPFYLHRVAKSGQLQSLFVSSTSDGTFTVTSERTKQPTLLQLDLEGILIIASTPEPDVVRINGQPLGRPRRVVLGDAFAIRGVPLDLRKLLFNHLTDEFSFQGEPDGACIVACSISNKPDADIHVPDRQGRRWRSEIRRAADGSFQYAHGDCPHRLLCHGHPFPDGQPLPVGERLTIAGFGLEVDGNVVRRYPPGVQNLSADCLTYYFPDRSIGIDEVAFEAERGDLICILGSSGSGKSTLLSILTGATEPTRGSVRIDGTELHRNARLQSRIGFVPQDDLLFENLTVGENLEYSARLRMPSETPARVESMVRKALREVGLRERRHVRAGSPLDKTLSGGERKRLNIGLELLGDYEILLLDEPTSGLSSGDALNVVEVLKNRALDGGILFAVAHQPSAKLLELFDKVLLLDRGGRVAFFGDVAAAFRYFRDHEGGDHLQANGDAESLDADFLFQALERSSLRIDGTPDRARRHPPEYWQDLFAKYRSTNLLGRLSHARPPQWTDEGPPRVPMIAARIGQFITLLRRETLNKWRNGFNLLVSLGSAVGLAFIVAYACRESSDGIYELARNRAFGNFLFLSTVVALFLSLSASATEIVKDRAIRMRERLLGIPNSIYLLSKLLPLLVIFLVQVALYAIVCFFVLGVRELWQPYWLLLGLTGFTGLSMGLFFSSLPSMTDKAAPALIPILLVPQIILSGAQPFPFERMAHLHWPGTRPANAREAAASPPWAAEFMPSRWSYEALVCLQRDFGFEQQYRNAIATVTKAKREPESVGEKTLSAAQAVKASGEADGKYSPRRMSLFYNEFSRDGSPSREVQLPWAANRVSRVFWNANVLALMGLAWLFLAWLVLKYGKPIRNLWGGRK